MHLYAMICELMYSLRNLGESRTVELSELISLLEKELDTHAIIDRQPPQPGDVTDPLELFRFSTHQ